MSRAQSELEHNIRRTVAGAAMRQVHKLLRRWESDERRGRRMALALGLVLSVAIVAFALYWASSATLVTIG